MKKLLALTLALTFLLGGLPRSTAAQVLMPEVMTDEAFLADVKGLNDPALPRYLEDSLYASLVSTLNSEAYFVENIEAVYISQDYLDELAYNSQANIFFGYTLAELEEEFQESKFIFTLGEDGTTVVEPFQDYDDTYDKVLKNVAIGSGVILICVTVSIVTAGMGAPAISLIFAASAKTGAIMAASGAAMGAASAGIVTGLQTKDMDAALKATALAGSEGFKWGAISGVVAGGVSEARYLSGLKGGTMGGLNLQEVVKIQRESGYPVDVIKQFRSMEQYEVFKRAGLTPQMVNGKTALIRQIDLDLLDEYGVSNRERLRLGKAAIEPITGKAYDLHHVGQKMDSSLAIMTEAEHVKNGNFNILHNIKESSQIDRKVFDKDRSQFWMSLLELLESRGV